MSTLVILQPLILWTAILLYPWFQPLAMVPRSIDGPDKSTSFRAFSVEHKGFAMYRLSKIVHNLLPWDTNSSVSREPRKFLFQQLEPRHLMAVTMDAEGWTVVTPSEDSRVIYVSSSEGNDANDGLSPENPKATISAGWNLLRNGKPDHLLFKRGDTFNGDLGFKGIDGLNEQEPILIGAYGSGDRPHFNTGGERFFRLSNPNYVVIQSLSVSTDREVDDWEGLAVTGGGSDILIEDVKMDGFTTNFVIDKMSGGSLSDITFRRNVSVNAWSDSSHSQGAFFNEIDGLVIEENIFDHNGWHETFASPTIFNHNIYIAEGNRDITIERNIFSRGSSMGTKVDVEESTIVIRDNLYVNNSLAGQFGVGSSDVDVEVQGNSLYVENNVMVEHEARANANGLGPNIMNVKEGHWRNNIMGQRPASDGDGAPWAFLVDDHTDGVGINNFDIDGNILYDWRARTRFENPRGSDPDYTTATVSSNTFTNNTWVAPTAANNALFETRLVDPAEFTYSGNQYYHPGDQQDEWFEVEGSSISTDDWKANYEADAKFEKPQFFDPTRTTRAYAAALGMTSFEEMAGQWHEQSRGNWNPVLHAEAINAYIREGFALDQVGVSPLPSPSIPTGSSIAPVSSYSPSGSSYFSLEDPTWTWMGSSPLAAPESSTSYYDYYYLVAESSEDGGTSDGTIQYEPQVFEAESDTTEDEYSVLVDEALADDELVR